MCDMSSSLLTSLLEQNTVFLDNDDFELPYEQILKTDFSIEEIKALGLESFINNKIPFSKEIKYQIKQHIKKRINQKVGHAIARTALKKGTKKVVGNVWGKVFLPEVFETIEMLEKKT